jgi:hypothetical protein
MRSGEGRITCEKGIYQKLCEHGEGSAQNCHFSMSMPNDLSRRNASVRPYSKFATANAKSRWPELTLRQLVLPTKT